MPKPVGAFPRVTAATWAAGGALLAVLVTGPIATGTGPHAGDANAPRFGFNISSVVRVHSATAWLLVGAVVWLAFEAARSKDGPTIFRTQVIVLLTLAQGAVGYTQYALGVPPVLVAAHIVGVTLLVVAITRTALLTPGPAFHAPEAT